jgi:hypothetical protein
METEFPSKSQATPDDKTQMSNQAQGPNHKEKWFWHSGIGISVATWILAFGLAQACPEQNQGDLEFSA